MSKKDTDEDIFKSESSGSEAGSAARTNAVSAKARNSCIIVIVLLLCIQIGAIVAASFYKPQPLDQILFYGVSVTPLDNGTLDITYSIRWKVLDGESDGALTWVKIGMANNDFSIKNFTGNAIRAARYENTYVRIDLDKNYYTGDIAVFGFTVNQRDMLCNKDGGYFYQFVPGWFCSIPVTKYEFEWVSNGVVSNNADATSGGNLVWSGSFEVAQYRVMEIKYSADAFAGAQTVAFSEFDGSTIKSELDDSGIWIAVGFLFVFLFIVQISFLDRAVSYSRGTGFMRSNGMYIYVNGVRNPKLPKSGGSSGGGGGGCACACACACAGGGRAGCSQKDTYGQSKSEK